MKMIKCKALSKRYRGESVMALDQLNLEVEKNSVFGFLGPNGAGKTTTIKILTGLMSQSSGQAWVAGEAVSKNNTSLRRKIGYLGQEQKMYGWMKGQELLQFIGEIFGLSKRERVQRAGELLEMAGLKDAAKKKVSSYSGGMLQRLGIAQALVGKPEVLLLDEPTSSLDPIGRKEVLDFITALRENCTVFMSTHILADVERVCDTIAIINKGKLVVEGNTDHLRKKYAPEVIEVELNDQEQLKSLNEYLNREGLHNRINQEKISISISTGDPDADKYKILRFITENNLAISRFELVNVTLEDVFIKLVEGKNEK
jgi:ABC-2 type transport system ATP-binding protein